MSDLISRKDAINEIKSVFDDVLCCNISVRKGLPEAVKRIEIMPSADRPKGMIHIDEVYRLIAGHSNYHGDSILSAFTCLVEGKDVKPIAPLNEFIDIPTGKWVPFYDSKNKPYGHKCSRCGYHVIMVDIKNNFCSNCGADMRCEEKGVK